MIRIFTADRTRPDPAEWRWPLALPTVDAAELSRLQTVANLKFEQFRDLVLRDDSLQKELASVEDRREFVRRVVELGRINSFEFDEQTVVDAMREARNSWTQRWK